MSENGNKKFLQSINQSIISVSRDWCWVRTKPPRRYRHWVAYLNWLFGAKPSVPRNAVTWTCDRLDCFSLIINLNFSYLQRYPELD
jgi:hypothetical protein